MAKTQIINPSQPKEALAAGPDLDQQGASPSQLPVPTDPPVPTEAAATMSSPQVPGFLSGLLSGGASPSGNEGFFPFVLERRDSFLGGGPGPEEPEDLALQLQQKEKDLLLAAELGKMLLERNEELQRQLETLNTQHSEREEVSWRLGQGGTGDSLSWWRAGGRQVRRGRPPEEQFRTGPVFLEGFSSG